MDHRILYTLLLILVALPCGCRFVRRSEPLNYQTLAVDSQHDTELAKEEHAKAIRFMNTNRLRKEPDLDKAERHLQASLVADVTFGPAHNTLGMLYFNRRSLYLAAWEFEYAAKLMPEHPQPLYNLGLVYECADDFDRAIEFYEKALCLAPDDPIFVGVLARASLRNGVPLDGVRHMLKELVLRDDRPDWVNWAKIELGTHPEELVSEQAATGPELISAPAPFPEALPMPQPEIPEADFAPEELPLPMGSPN